LPDIDAYSHREESLDGIEADGQDSKLKKGKYS